MCITAVTGGRRVWVVGPQRDGLTSERDAVSCVFTLQACSRVLSCGDGEGGGQTPGDTGFIHPDSQEEKPDLSSDKHETK